MTDKVSGRKRLHTLSFPWNFSFKIVTRSQSFFPSCKKNYQIGNLLFDMFGLLAVTFHVFARTWPRLYSIITDFKREMKSISMHTDIWNIGRYRYCIGSSVQHYTTTSSNANKWHWWHRRANSFLWCDEFWSLSFISWTASRGMVSFEVSPSYCEGKAIVIEAVVLSKVTTEISSISMTFDTKWKHLIKLQLSDPDFGPPGSCRNLVISYYDHWAWLCS